MNYNILNIHNSVNFDSSIKSLETHIYQPYASRLLSNNDEVRISIQQQNLYTLPSESYIYIEGTVSTHDDRPATNTKFINNGILFLFEEIRYEIGGITIDRIRNPGVTTTMKSYISYSTSESVALKNAGWSHTSDVVDDLLDAKGNFSVCIPLRMVMGFAEDYKNIIVNQRQDLVLIRDNIDTNALFVTNHVAATDTEKPKVNLRKVCWYVPHVLVSDAENLKLSKYIDRSISHRDRDLSVAFRGWELHEYPLLPQTQDHTWVVKTSSQLEKPRYVIFGMQHDKKNKYSKNMSTFDHGDLMNLKIELNSNTYPYENLNLDFDNNRWSHLYQMFISFRKSYYNKEIEPQFTPSQFKTKCPLAVIDCSHQDDETENTGVVDLKINFQTRKNVPAETTAYCLVLYDKMLKYRPLSGDVKLL